MVGGAAQMVGGEAQMVGGAAESAQMVRADSNKFPCMEKDGGGYRLGGAQAHHQELLLHRAD